jgi:hypothetical protein
MRGPSYAFWPVIAVFIATFPRMAAADGQRIPLRLGLPPIPATLTARPAPDGLRLEVRGSGAPIRWVLPAGAEARIEVDSTRLSSGAEVASVRVVDGSARWVSLVAARRGRPVLLWQGRLDLVGDPGERRASAIELADRTGDGAPDVVVGSIREDTFICGQPPALLDPHAVHPQTLELRPVVLRRLPELPPGEEVEVVPSPSSPGPEARPLVDTLHFRRASSAAGVAAGSSVIPVGVGDGDETTAWVEGAGEGTFEFATATWGGGAGLPIRAFSIVPRPDGPLASSTRPPAAVWLVGDRGSRLRVPLPSDAPPGVRYWVVPPEPLAWGCVSVVFDAGDVRGAPSSHLAIAELEGYSEVDFGGGIPHLVAELSASAARADRAAGLLSRMGRPALDAISAAFPDMPSDERVRAVRIVAAIARSVPPALDVLGRAVLAPEPEVSRSARRALFAFGPAGARALAAVAADEPSGEALMELAERHPELALEPTLAALAASGGLGRPALRHVLARCAREATEPTLAAIASRLDGPPELVAVYAESLAATGEPGRAMAARALAAAIPRAEGFEARFRLGRAAAELAPDGLPEEVTRFLEERARAAEEWMMRAEALRALSMLDAPPIPLLLAALEDPYPRVRLGAIRALAPRLQSTRASAVKVAELARRDPFPFVRAAAVTALGPVDAALPVVEAALRDRAERVRAAAVLAFAARGDASAWPLIEQRMRDDGEWPVVTDASIAYARDLCIEASVDALRLVLERAERPRGWDPHRTSAGLATEALASIGTPAARDVLSAAAARPDQGVGRLAARALARPRACGGSANTPSP